MRLLAFFLVPLCVTAQTYQTFAGSTHAHTSYTWSHGEHLEKSECAGILVFGPNAGAPQIHTWSEGYVKRKKCAAILVLDGAQYPSPDMAVRVDWKEHQGPPSEHFRLAKAAGYDFYITTDHSQEAAFQRDAKAWSDTKQSAAAATTRDFVALAGFEYSENDGPGGQGHINVINSDGILNALKEGIDLPYFYNWLKTAAANGAGPVVASFNHPGPKQYADWAHRDPQVTEIIAMLEVINSNNKIHYEAFVNALDKGWKVSPVCGNDNHGVTGIRRQTSRTIVLATEKTKAAILDGMKNRRTYASLAPKLQARYSVNGAIMGSTLRAPASFQFDIALQDAGDPITKVDIVKDGGAVVETYTPAASDKIEWRPTITDGTSRYFFVRVWTAKGGDAPGADASKPVAWLAPVWTGR